jgi:hypothetical protein
MTVLIPQFARPKIDIAEASRLLLFSALDLDESAVLEKLHDVFYHF